MTIPEIEAEVLDFWKKNNIFEKSVEQNPDTNRYVFYDGPPFISGLPHYGALLASIAKDVVPRYWTMKGKRVERVWGWDAHGLTVENRVQEKLGIKRRRDIESFGVEKFVQACYSYTSETSAEWNWYIDRIGRWVDMDHAYRTTDQKYMESVMWAFSELYKKGLLYEGVRTSLFCPTCGTPVSNFEITMDNSYKEVEDPAVTIKFEIVDNPELSGVYILAWTTTPWTLPSNRALVVAEKENYVLVESNGEKYIVGEKRAEVVFSGIPYKVLQTIPGSKLIGLKYKPLYTYFDFTDKEFKVYSFEDMANMEEGTGIVHSAPGFGEIDSKMGVHYGITLMQTIDDEGKFIAGNKDKNPYEGVFYKKTDDPIREDLKTRGLLFKDERVTHRFPYHDRCNTLLIQKAQNSWFVDVAKLKPELAKNNEAINWVPEHNKYGRFKQNIEQAPDWCISRSRFWATPMPVWQSSDGDRIIVSSIKELEELSGMKVMDLHRPYIDEIVIKKNNKEYHRIPEVLDSWFEAGSMPYAQVHYPFENQEKFESTFPGDFIVEYVAQVRAWFHVMHIMSTALFGKNSFKNVIVTGVIAGNDGRKMSKTFHNYPDPRETLETIGGDAVRLYLMSSPLMLGENANFDEAELKNKLRNVLNPLWNSLKYYELYAPAKPETTQSDDILDIWIEARLKQTIIGVSKSIEAYTIPPAVKFIEEFVDDLSKWYVRRSRDRISSGDTKALSTLYHVLLELSKAAAPVIPFLSEKIYQSLAADGKKESVHLETYPVAAVLSKDEEKILVQMKTTRDIVSAALSVRVAEGIKVRQPLKALYVVFKEGKKQDYFEDLIKDEVNVKEASQTTQLDDWSKSLDAGDFTVILDTTISEDLMLEGLAREVVRAIQDLRKTGGLSVGDFVNATYPQTPENEKAVEKFAEEISRKIQAKKLSPSDGYTIEKVNG